MIPLLRRIQRAALAAVDPAACLRPHLPEPEAGGRVIIIAVGKAAMGMARAAVERLGDETEGVLLTRRGHLTGGPVGSLRIYEAGHPLPDEAGWAGARAILDALTGLKPEDHVLALLSGGASALMALPMPGLSLADLLEVTGDLLAAGVPISQINIVRRHLLALGGGRMAQAAGPARLSSFVLSDVPGDDPATIASGPTLGDASTRHQALAVLDRFGIAAPGARAWLARPESETPKPGDTCFTRGHLTVIGGADLALAAAAAEARASGVTPFLLGAAVEGDAQAVGQEHGALAKAIGDGRAGVPVRAPTVLLSGGETTAAVHGPGRGGRNAEYALGLLLGAEGAEVPVWGLAMDTDGVDGTGPGAGAIVTPHTWARARQLGLDPRRALAASDSHGFFQALGDLVVTGPTGTNVGDLRVVIVGSTPAGEVA